MKKRLLYTLLVCLVFVPSAYPQVEGDGSPEDGTFKAPPLSAPVIRIQPERVRVSEDGPFVFALVAYNAAAIADTASTVSALGKGGFREANPLLGSASENRTGFVVLKAGLAAGATYGLIRLWQHNRKAAFWLSLVAAGVNGAVAAHNFSKAR